MQAKTFRPNYRSSFRNIALICFSLFVIFTSVVAIVRFRPKDLIPGNHQPWTTTGSFAKGGAWPFTTFDPQMSDRDKKLDFFGSWSATPATTGEMRSPVFKAPRIMECFVSGYLGKTGLNLYLERQTDHLRFPLTLPANSFPGEVWRRYHWGLPQSVQEQQVMLVAEDASSEPSGWFGVSTPRRFSYLALLHQQLPSNLFLVGHFLLNFLLFLLPGFALACLIQARLPSYCRYPVIIVIAGSSIFGYLIFYTFLGSKHAGKILVFCIYLTSIALILLAFRSKDTIGSLFKQVAEPLAISASAALCYLCFTFMFINPLTTGAGYLDGRFFTEQRPGDNMIPLFFAERIYDRKPLRPFCCGDWLTSDRPPLQTGIFLMERPLPLTSNVELNYELLSTGLQCLWICGAWCVLASLGAEIRHIRIVLAVLIFSGFNFYNSVYTWPKFLAATFILFTVSTLIDLIRNRRVAENSDAIIAALCVGLALVSHTASVFSLFTLPIFLIKFTTLFPIRKWVLVVPIVLIFVLPWSAYQKLVDPPGDRLLKWHLAGIQEINTTPAFDAIAHAYASRSALEIVKLRLSNIRTLAGFKPFDSLGLHDLAPKASIGFREWHRIMQIEFFWNALGILNLGWFATLFLLLRKRSTRKIAHSGWIILTVAVNILIWCCLEFGPEYSLMAHCSLADYLLVSIALFGFILELPWPAVAASLAVQLFNFAVVWAWSPPYLFNVWAGTLFTVSLQIPLLICGTLLTLGLLTHLCQGLFRMDTSVQEAIWQTKNPISSCYTYRD